MADFDELAPAFASPLTDEQHARLGRIAVLWGHIDWLLDEILLKVLKLSRAQREELIGEKPIGPKLAYLKPAIARIKDDRTRDAVQAMYTILNNTKGIRNHVFHGAWGWRAHDRTKSVTVAARHPKSPTNPVEATQLPWLERELCRASRFADDAFALLRTGTTNPGCGRFAHHGSKGRPRKWFVQWLQQHPLRDANFDRSFRAGELLRLIDPLE